MQPYIDVLCFPLFTVSPIIEFIFSHKASFFTFVFGKQTNKKPNNKKNTIIAPCVIFFGKKKIFKNLCSKALVCSDSSSEVRSFRCERNGNFYFKISNPDNRYLSRIKPIPFSSKQKAVRICQSKDKTSTGEKPSRD